MLQLTFILETAQYANGVQCGRTITITDTATGKTAVGTVADECPGCNGSGSIDLSEGLFEVFAPTSQGVFPALRISMKEEQKGDAIAKETLHSSFASTTTPISSIVSTNTSASIMSTSIKLPCLPSRRPRVKRVRSSDYPPLDDEANERLKSGSSGTRSSRVGGEVLAVNPQGIQSPVILEACLRTCQQHHLDLEALFHGHVYGERTLIYHVILGTESIEPETKQRVCLMLELLSKIPLDEKSNMDA
ncbi:hypothetical protein M422DRAFT_265299 [Sphaerobolus stellatus SS14]|uniref:Uncharacterized protein n=1 Tax=Sphaerobolus stellatus (strain SS14) TaxID=990650 RepID=A0A0C9V5Z9_SPHS4|nr:hypothetical protein M422DRAFT_265299 [Sphaerobolus stellatus SS14]